MVQFCEVFEYMKDKRNSKTINLNACAKSSQPISSRVGKRL